MNRFLLCIMAACISGLANASDYSDQIRQQELYQLRQQQQRQQFEIQQMEQRLQSQQFDQNMEMQRQQQARDREIYEQQLRQQQPNVQPIVPPLPNR